MKQSLIRFHRHFRGKIVLTESSSNCVWLRMCIMTKTFCAQFLKQQSRLRRTFLRKNARRQVRVRIQHESSEARHSPHLQPREFRHPFFEEQVKKMQNCTFRSVLAIFCLFPYSPFFILFLAGLEQMSTAKISRTLWRICTLMCPSSKTLSKWRWCMKSTEVIEINEVRSRFMINVNFQSRRWITPTTTAS